MRLQLTLISSILEMVTPGTACAIHLSDSNAKKLSGALDCYINKACKVSRKRSTGHKANSAVDIEAVRAWAASDGNELSSRGRVPASVFQQYRSTGN
jgi:hypothetical protein